MIFENAAEEIKGMDSVQDDIKPGIHNDIGETNSLLPFVFAAPYISWETNKVRPSILTNQGQIHRSFSSDSFLKFFGSFLYMYRQDYGHFPFILLHKKMKFFLNRKLHFLFSVLRFLSLGISLKIFNLVLLWSLSNNVYSPISF